MGSEPLLAPQPSAHPMRTWKPQPSIMLWIGIALLVAALIGAALVGSRLGTYLDGAPESWPVNLGLYGLVLLMLALLAASGALAYRIAAALTLRYELDRNGLYIVWLGNRAVVPLDQIQTVDLGVHDIRLPYGSLQRLGYTWGRARGREGRIVHLFATQAPQRCLAISTAAATYAVSPADNEAFVQDLEQRRALGATMPLQASVAPSRIFLYEFWNDRTVRTMLLVAFAINLLVLGLLAARYPQLAPEVQMRFDAVGEVVELRPRHQVLFLPLAAFGLSVLNTGLGLLLYRAQQLGARLLQGASIVVQLLFGIAVYTVIR